MPVFGVRLAKEDTGRSHAVAVSGAAAASGESFLQALREAGVSDERAAFGASPPKSGRTLKEGTFVDLRRASQPDPGAQSQILSRSEYAPPSRPPTAAPTPPKRTLRWRRPRIRAHWGLPPLLLLPCVAWLLGGVEADHSVLALIEWTAVMAACTAFWLSLVHYSIRRDVSVPVFGAALLLAGLLGEGAHALGEVPEEHAGSSKEEWALAHVLAGAALVAAALRAGSWRRGPQSVAKVVVAAAVVLVAVHTAVARLFLADHEDEHGHHEHQDHGHEAEHLAWGVTVTALYAAYGVVLRRRCHSRSPRLRWVPGLEAGSVVFVAAHFYAGIVSTARHDTWDTTGHVLMVAAFVVPTVGFAGDLGLAYHESRARARTIVDLHDALVRERDRALEAAEAKQRFVAAISHELRTPLHGIIGNAELALDGGAGARGHLDVVLSSATTLLDLVNNVLLFSEAQGESARVHLEHFRPADVVGDVVRLLGPVAEKTTALEASVAPDVPELVCGDAGKVRQILLNLVGNAIKFADGQPVAVRLLRAAPGVLRLEVEDSGVGIPEDKLLAIFQPFQQSDDSTKRAYGGSGLGLAICAQLAPLVGGTLAVSSAPGAGSTFRLAWAAPEATDEHVCRLTRPRSSLNTPGATLRSARSSFSTTPAASFRGPQSLPASQGTTPRAVLRPLSTSTSVAPEPPPRRRALVVDDNLVNRRLLCKIMEKEGFDCATATNGLEAVAAYSSDPSVDVVLMDCHMPEMDGLDATRRIRELQLEAGGGGAPVVAVTASAFPQDRERCRDAGMTGFVSKPFTRAQIVGEVERVLL